MENADGISRRGFIASVAGIAGTIALGLVGCGRRDGDGDASGGSDTGEDRNAKEEQGEGTVDTEADSAKGTETDVTGGSGSPVNGITVVFSWSGNTASVADAIAGHMEMAPVWHLMPKDPYPEDYDECTDVALQEQRDETMPEYLNDIPGWDDYKVVFVGYPIWWSDLPQVMKSFIRDHEWDGKKVVPFITSQSSGWSGTQDTIREMCQGATVLEGLSLFQSELPDRLTDVPSWLDGLGLS